MAVPDTRLGRAGVALLFFILPAIIYWAVLTRLGFDLFAPSYGWQAYNHFALALADGRQSVPAEAIAAEGTYIGGSVYMYYGVLPALLRLPLIPFVDLRVVPLSNLLVLAMLVIGQWAMQMAVLRIFVANGRTGVFADRAALVVVSFATWFSSGAFLLIQNASFYREPFAAAHMLVSIFLAMLAEDLLVQKRRLGVRRLVLYALVAGLCVHARQSTAIGLYIATLALLLPTWSDLRQQPGSAITDTIRRSILPLGVLFIAGAAYLGLAYLRTGHIGTGWAVEDYGYYILGNNRPRLRTMIEQQFDLVRVIPNTFYVLFGGQTLREDLIYKWGGGIVVSFGTPVRWALFAPVPLLLAAMGAVCLWRRTRARDPLAPALLVITAGFAASAAVLLAYATMQYRYTAEVWPLVAWLMLIAMRDVDPTALLGRFLVPALIVLAVLSVGSLAYTYQLRSSLLNDSPSDRGSLRVGVPLAPELAARATAPGARDPRINATRDAAGADPDLPPGWKVQPGFPAPRRVK
jgi:hypothetical protein